MVGDHDFLSAPTARADLAAVELQAPRLRGVPHQVGPVGQARRDEVQQDEAPERRPLATAQASAAMVDRAVE